MFITVRDPETKTALAGWSSNDFKCRAARGLEPINESCGGCAGCMELQAVHYGHELVYEYEDFNEYWDVRIGYYKKYAQAIFDKPQLMNMLRDEALELWNELHKESK
jgi:hypothetical protein